MTSSQEEFIKRIKFFSIEIVENIVQILGLPELETHDFVDFIDHLETILWHQSSQKDQLIHEYNDIHEAPEMIERGSLQPLDQPGSESQG